MCTMETKIFTNSIGNTDEIIKTGGLVAVPTETVYGLAANGLDSEAVERIYEVKGRPAVKPLSLMVAGREDIERLCVDVPDEVYAITDEFWPGPVTIILKARTDIIPEIVRAGGVTIGLRCPDSKLTLALIKSAGVPLAAPSANPSGQPSPKNAQSVISCFDGAIEAIIDGGECTLGIESTIVDMTEEQYKILRQGALSKEKINEVLKLTGKEII